MNSGLLNGKKEKYCLQPGYIFVSKEPHLLTAALGSCVSVCMWDSELKFGGMSHYIKSCSYEKEKTAKFGNISIKYMIELMKKLGSNKTNLKAHIVGGAENPNAGSNNISRQNIEIAEKLLEENKIKVKTADTGGKMGRKIVFDSETGEIVIYKVNNMRKSDWYSDRNVNS